MDLDTAVLWIRHAPTHSKAFVGWSDIDADLGDVNTIAWLQNRIPENSIVVSSDLQRASKTADAITGQHLRLPNAPELREINFGDWEGKTADEISQSHPDESYRFWNDPVNSGTPRGETWRELSERASKFVDKTIYQYPHRTIIAVSHFGTILSQALRAMNAEDHNLLSKTIRNLSVTHLQRSGINWYIKEFSILPD